MNLVLNSLNYFFSPSPGKHFAYYIPLLVFAILLIALAIAIFIMVKQAKSDKAFRHIFKSYPQKLVIIGACLGLYLGCRYEQIPFLSTRFVLFIILAIAAIFLFLMGRSYLYTYPQEKKKYEEQEEKNKYIPRKHKK